MNESSLYGDPPMWSLEVDPDTRTVTIYWQPEMTHFPDRRVAIDEMASVLEMLMHEVARG